MCFEAIYSFLTKCYMLLLFLKMFCSSVKNITFETLKNKLNEQRTITTVN